MKNIVNKLQIHFMRVESNEKIQNFIKKKFKKHSALVSQIKLINFNIALESSKGLYKVTIETFMDQLGFVVKSTGKDVYELITQATDNFYAKLLKFEDKKTDKSHKIDWSGQKKNIFFHSERFLKGLSDLAEFRMNTEVIPHIEKKVYANNSPIHINEAIQIMEKFKRPFLLFKNIATGKYSVVYRLGTSFGYGVMEPEFS